MKYKNQYHVSYNLTGKDAFVWYTTAEALKMIDEFIYKQQMK